ncbi:transporter [Thalassospira profundimaris]|uniref:Transporter n=1 Tax=Thalassospira profundimaris TaxID=502049 RepID=A0A367WX79_9PROT|nr:efflux RND transporter permease subunit [Thalassospira profundimaris]RCK45998.1 transporter [Thalassospira profundimaris]
MNIPRFFVDRPIFAVVLSVLMLIAGGLTLLKLPLSEYPQVTPPTVQVTASYPGANPEVIAETVAAPLEQAINGVENMLYMSSQAATDGRMTLTIAFKQGTDPDMAQIQVQNRVSRALPRLPLEVQRIGVVTQKTSPDILMVVHLVSPDDRYDPLYLSNFAILQVRDQLARLPGVGDVILGGAGEYSMRIWLDPAKVAARGLTASDIVAAIQEQNVQVAAGSVGQQPEASAAFQVTVNTLGRLSSEEQFGEIVIKAGTDGQVTRLRDVARIELGADSYALRSLLDGKPALAMQIIQSPGANALDVSSAVRTTMAEFQKGFPEGIEYRIAYDPTVFVKASLEAVVMTLLEAVVLVVIVVVLFLQTWRASIIPLVAVPVSLVGTFALMYMFGFSLNTLSLFGLVLSIGIVVDDAIVVVENVERHIALGETPKEAARKAMDEVTGPIVAITSVLSAVFIPSAFLSGLQGEFYRQFALTIAISTILSAINSLTLSPALAGVLLKPHHGDVKRDLPTRVIDFLFGWFFRLFNRFGRTYRVMVQADAPFRMQPEDIGRLKVRNSAGDMIPLSALLTIKHSSGPDRVMHYNGFPSADISGSPAPGYSFGQATAAMERIASETLPPGMAFEWTDLAYQEKQAGNTAMFVFPLSVLLAFLILAAQYNSWSLPFAVLLIAPMALLSAIAGVWFTGGDNNIFTQIGFVVLVGLAAKNAILIVEFARAKEDEGVDPLAAVLEAARLRLRPILMTSLAFIAGVVPLVIATGAGAEMRHAMGIAVFAGMLGVTLFGLLLTPIFYVVVRRLAIRRDPSPQQATKAHA